MTRPWRCPDCHQTLGYVVRDRPFSSRYREPALRLELNSRVDKVVPRVTVWVIYCECGAYREWCDGKVTMSSKPVIH